MEHQKKWMGEEGLILFAAVQAAVTKLGSENKAILYIQENKSYYPLLERPVGIKARYYEVKSKHPTFTLIEDDFANRFGKLESYIKNIEALHQQIVEHYAALYEK